MVSYIWHVRRPAAPVKVLPNIKISGVVIRVDSLLSAFRSLGPSRILALFFGLAAVIAIAGFTFTRINQPGLALLYGGLSAQEASAITQYLDSQNIPYEVKNEGSVYVPSTQVGQLRLSAAGQGLVGGSTSGYELFDNTSAFGTTNFVQNLNAKRALEGELARTIGSLPAVQGARVHVVLPKQNLFSRQLVEPTAAVALNLGNRALEEGQVNSIAQLVAAAVPNLKPQAITIIDQRGTLLFDGKQQTPGMASTGKFQQQVEDGLVASLTTMLERITGVGKAQVRVKAQINTEKIEENSEIYDPTQQVVRSEQSIESSNNSSDTSGNAPVGVAGNIPAEGGAGASGGGANSAENRTETTTNYEIGKTIRTRVKEGGEIEKLSIAVLVEGKTTVAENGDVSYTPMSDDELTNIRRLVEGAVGFDAGRGDKVEVVDMQFTAPPEPPAIDTPMITTDQALNLGQYALLLAVLLVVVFMVLKPAMKLLTASLGTPLTVNMVAAGGAKGGVNMVSASGAPTESSLIDIGRVEGRVKESSVKKVTEIIDQHPEESLNVVRNWMGGSSGDAREDA
jgi:flagellar M-ring protein FliF